MLNDLARQVALRFIPVGIDAERLDVNTLGVHLPHTLVHWLLHHEQRLGRYRVPHQGHGFRHRTVRVHIDGLDPTAAQDHLPARCSAAGRRQGRCRLRQTTADKHEVSHGADLILEELPLSAHRILSA